MAADIAQLLRHQANMEAVRRLREPEWQQIANYFLPTKNFLVELLKGQSLPRYVRTSVPQKALMRFGAMLLGYLIDPSHPFLAANVQQGLVNKGRSSVLDSPSADYIDGLGWMIFKRMMNPRCGFMAALSRFSLEFAAFGNGVMWVGHKRGFGPIYMSRPIRQCYFDITDEDIVNRLHYAFKLKVWEIKERWPEGFKASECLTKMAAENQGLEKEVKLLHCVYPRMGATEAGGVGQNKPFAEVIFMPDHPKEAALLEGGYDEFPYAVARQRVAEGNPYGQGQAWLALPDAIEINRLQDYVEYGIGAHVAPPMFTPARIFRKIDRRLGAINPYDPKMLGFQTIKDAIQYLPAGGDLGIGTDYMKMLQTNIDDAFMIDWMKLPDHGQMTAEEVRDRRQLRAVGLTGLLPALDRELMGILGDRTLDILVRENMIPAPPEQLQGVDVEWDYAGPLAMAQKQSQVQAYAQLVTLAQQAASVDQTAAEAMLFDEGLRLMAENLGLPPRVLMTREDMAKKKQVAQQAQADQAQADQAQQAGQALQAGAQGLHTLASVQGMAGGGGQPQGRPQGVAA